MSKRQVEVEVNPKHKSESPGDMLARLRSILEEKRLKVTHCEEELAKVRADGEAKLDAARAEVAAYLDEVAGILGVKLAKRPGPRSKKSSGDDEAATGFRRRRTCRGVDKRQVLRAHV